MKITEIRIKPATSTYPQDRLLGFASIVLDGGFAVCDIKIISGTNGIFVAMPSRKVAVHCPTCQSKNTIGSNFCNQCGGKIPPIDYPPEQRPKLFFDIAHPINAEARALIEAEIIAAYHAQTTAAPAAAPIPARTQRRFFTGAQ